MKPATFASQDRKTFLAQMQKSLLAAAKWKEKMKQLKVRQAQATCPSCGKKDAAYITLNGLKDHLHARCRAEGCNWRIME